MIHVRENPDGSEVVEFVSLAVQIRGFVDSVAEGVSENDHNDQIGQVLLVNPNVPEVPEVRESFEAERRNGNQVEREIKNSADNEKQNLASSSLPEQNVPEDTAAPETAEQQRKRKGKMIAYEDSENSADNKIQNQLVLYSPERHAPENAELVEAPGTSGDESRPNGNEVAVYENPQDSDDDTSRTISDVPTEVRNVHCRSQVNKKTPKKAPKKRTFRKLSDLFRELEDENVEIPFPNPFVDDITQMSPRRRQVYERAKLRNKKKHKARKTKESPSLDEAGPSDHVRCTGPCGSESMVHHAGRAKPSSPRPGNCKESREPCNSGSMVGRVRNAKPTNHGQAKRKRSSGPSGSPLAVCRVNMAKPLKRGRKRLRSDDGINDPSLIEVGDILLSLNEEMIKELDCKGLGNCDGCEPSASQPVVVRDVEATGLPDDTEMEMQTEMETEMETETEIVQAREPENLVCVLNQNPAEFSPEEAEKFFREI